MSTKRNRDLPPELITEIQKYTGVPWWNGRAYVAYRGYDKHVRDSYLTFKRGRELEARIRDAGLFEYSDHLRDILNKLENSIKDIAPEYFKDDVFERKT